MLRVKGSVMAVRPRGRMTKWLVIMVAALLILPLGWVAPAAAGSLLTVPAGGESWFVGTVHNITWNYAGITGLTNTVDLDFSTDSGNTWSSIEHDLQLAGQPQQYAWTVPNASTTHARIKITVNYTILSSSGGFPPSITTTTEVGGFGQSGDFTIAALVPSLPVYLKAPTDLTAAAASSSEIDLAWKDNASNETVYNIERKSGSGNYAVVTQVAANTTSYKNTGLSASATTPLFHITPITPITPVIPGLFSTVLKFYIGQSAAKVNGASVPIDANNPGVTPVIVNGRTILPLRFIGEQLGCQVDWDQAQQLVTVTYPKP
ncbi:MAG: stalk domain-containing protein [Thermacetogeniaceae bacterium]